MKEVTVDTKYVEKENAKIIIGGTPILAFIEGEIGYTYTYYPEYYGYRGMEDAEPSDEEITLDSVKLNVHLYCPASDTMIKFVSKCPKFYAEHFGELESCDVL